MRRAMCWGLLLCVAWAGCSFAAPVSGGRALPVPDGVLEKVCAAPRVEASNATFSVALRLCFAPFEKARGKRDGLVFSNGNGWNHGFRVTATPLSVDGCDYFRLDLRVVDAAGKGHHYPAQTRFLPGRWYSLVYVCDGRMLRCYVNGAQTTARPYGGGAVKKAVGRFTVGPAGFGVGYHPFSAKDIFLYERALTDDEVRSALTGGSSDPSSVAQWLLAQDEGAFAALRPLAWQTAQELSDGGKKAAAHRLYALLATRRPHHPSEDAGCVAAARLASALSPAPVAPAVAEPVRQAFRGYPAYRPAPFSPAPDAVYLSPAGDDAQGDGTRKRPFATLARAVEALRDRPTRQILLLGGRYALTAGWRLTKAEQGPERAPLVIAAAPGETPVLDGGREVSRWEKTAHPEILAASLKGKGFLGLAQPRAWGYALAGKSERHLLDLYEADVPGELARHPNKGFFATTWADKTNRLFKIDVPDLAAWANEPYLMAQTYLRWFWGDETTRVTVFPQTGTLQIDTNLVSRVGKGHPFKFVNALRALDEPGEWFVDHLAERLYYWPRRRGARVVLSQLAEPLLTLEGAAHVEIRGLTFEAGRSAGLVLRDCDDVRVIGNTLRNLGSGVHASGRNLVLFGNRLRSFARGGVTATGGDRRTLMPSGIRLLRNDISDVERKVRTYCPCVQAEGVGIEISQNHLHDAPSSAIRLEGNDMLILSNLVERCVLESDDQGAVDIYANPTYAGIRIIGNTWRDIGRGGPFAPCGQAAVRFDDVISGVEVRLNRFYRCGIGHFGAVQINGGRLNVIDNNLFVDCRLDCSVNQRTAAWWERTMTEGYCAPKIRAMKVEQSPWRERYGYLSEILSWPCVNYISRNLYVNTQRTSRARGVNGNRSFPSEPETLPPGYDKLGPLFRK